MDFCPSGLSYSSREVKFAREASMVAQVKGAEHFPDTQHVALCYTLKGPRILVVLFHFSLFLVHGFQALSAKYLKKKKLDGFCKLQQWLCAK